MQDSSKFRKLSTTDQIEGLLSSQRSILDGIVDVNRNNDFVEDKHKNSNTFQTKLDISEEKSNKSDDNNSSQTRYSVLSMHKRRKTVFLPVISRNKINNDSKPNLNTTNDSNLSVLSKKNFDSLGIKHSIDDKNGKPSKLKKSSKFKPQSKEPK